MNVVKRQAQVACRAVSLGRFEYVRAWDMQRSLHRHVADGLLPSLLLLLERPHVYTLGRRDVEGAEYRLEDRIANLVEEF